MASVETQQHLTTDRVQLMINDAIAKYDDIQKKRHDEFMEQTAPVFEWVMKQRGAQGFLRWAVPIMVMLITAIFEMHRILK
jgi:hypothetical protein